LLNECANEREILRTLEERVNGRLQSSLLWMQLWCAGDAEMVLNWVIFRDLDCPPFHVSRGLARYALSAKDID
jgi:hypothetical protein